MRWCRGHIFSTLSLGSAICILVVVGDVASAQVQMAGAAIRGEGLIQMLDCGGRDAIVGGSRNTATFAGACAMLQIRGDANTVTVALAPGALIDIEGSRNRVRISTSTGALPRLHVAGGNSDVAPLAGSSAPAADSAQLAGEAQTITLECHGGPATMTGTRNQITLVGGCSALTLRGETSITRATLADSAQVLVEGDALTLIYSVAGAGTPPTLTLHGMGSAAVRVGRENALSLRDPKTNTIVGTLPVLVRDLDAVIVEAGTLVPLPSAVFSDVALSAAGEMQLDRLVALIGKTNPSGVRVMARDPSKPAVAERVAIVRRWLQSHGVKSVTVQASPNAEVSDLAVLALR